MYCWYKQAKTPSVEAPSVLCLLPAEVGVWTSHIIKPGIYFVLFPLFLLQLLITSGMFLISASCSSRTGSAGKWQGPPVTMFVSPDTRRTTQVTTPPHPLQMCHLLNCLTWWWQFKNSCPTLQPHFQRSHASRAVSLTLCESLPCSLI